MMRAEHRLCVSSSVGLSIQGGYQTASPLGDAVGGLPSVGPVMHNGRAVGKRGNQVWGKCMKQLVCRLACKV